MFDYFALIPQYSLLKPRDDEKKLFHCSIAFNGEREKKCKTGLENSMARRKNGKWSNRNQPIENDMTLNIIEYLFWFWVWPIQIEP